MRFFFDRHIAWLIVETLRDQNGVDAVERRQGIGPKDEDWLATAGQNGWIVITLDHQILSRKLQKRGLHDHQVTAFFGAGEDHPVERQGGRVSLSPDEKIQAYPVPVMGVR